MISNIQMEITMTCMMSERPQNRDHATGHI